MCVQDGLLSFVTAIYDKNLAFKRYNQGLHEFYYEEFELCRDSLSCNTAASLPFLDDLISLMWLHSSSLIGCWLESQACLVLTSKANSSLILLLRLFPSLTTAISMAFHWDWMLLPPAPTWLMLSVRLEVGFGVQGIEWRRTGRKVQIHLGYVLQAALCS